MQHVILYRVDDVHNMRRFYRLEIQRDLFGNHCVLRTWGRIGKCGQMRSAPYPTEADAQSALQKQRATKECRGYAA